MDKRDEQTWVVLELSHAGESRAKEGLLPKLVRQELQVDEDYPVFVPIQVYQKGDKTIRIDGMQGYAFVKAGLPDHVYFSLEFTDIIKNVISTSHKKGRILACVPDSAIEGVRDSIRREVSQDLIEGTRVKVRTGLFSYLEGTVIDREADDIILEIKMRSIHAIIRVHGLYVDLAEEGA